MAIIIDGKILASKIEDSIVADGIKQNNSNKNCTNNRPNLAIVLIGERSDSKIYVDVKEKKALRVGIDTSVYRLDKNEKLDNVLNVIDFLNNDKSIDGILIQLPLPKHLDTDAIIRRMDPKKDVDRFHPDNLGDFSILPPLFASVNYILDIINCKIFDKKIGIVAKPKPFGNELSKFLIEKGGDVKLIELNDKKFVQKTSECDILITIIGKAKFIKKEMVKKGSIIIDMGITKNNDGIYGDVDFEDVQTKIEYITPVPGGVGPLTVAFALKNTFDLWKGK